MLSKSEREAEEARRNWMEEPDVDSDEFDTDLEDDFPPEEPDPMDNTGKFIYHKHCLKSGEWSQSAVDIRMKQVPCLKHFMILTLIIFAVS